MHHGPPDTLDELDRRIVAALHVDGRATWRRIAAVLGEPERTVTRRGMRLLESGAVEVRGLPDPHRTGRGEPFIVQASFAPGMVWSAAVAIARRPETVITHLLSGTADCIADIWCPENRLSSLLLHELGATPGLLQTSTAPILRYIRTVHDWQPGILTADEVEELRVLPAVSWPRFSDPVSLNREERVLMDALSEDGRRTYEELARIAGVSEQTARRRVDFMRQDELVAIRAIVDPRLLGLPIAALLRLRTAPHLLGPLADLLAESPYVHYAVVVMGEYQLVVDVRLPTKAALYEFLVNPPWSDLIAMESSLITDVLKQSGVLAPELR